MNAFDTRRNTFYITNLYSRHTVHGRWIGADTPKGNFPWTYLQVNTVWAKLDPHREGALTLAQFTSRLKEHPIAMEVCVFRLPFPYTRMGNIVQGFRVKGFSC